MFSMSPFVQLTALAALLLLLCCFLYHSSCFPYFVQLIHFLLSIKQLTDRFCLFFFSRTFYFSSSYLSYKYLSTINVRNGGPRVCYFTLMVTGLEMSKLFAKYLFNFLWLTVSLNHCSVDEQKILLLLLYHGQLKALDIYRHQNHVLLADIVCQAHSQKVQKGVVFRSKYIPVIVSWLLHQFHS